MLTEQIDQLKKAQTKISSLKVQLEEREAVLDFETCSALQNQIDSLSKLFLSIMQRNPLPTKASIRWQSDSAATECPICDSRFGFFRRKHHCRICGNVVCGECSQHSVAENQIFCDGKEKNSSRVCDSCFKLLLRGGESFPFLAFFTLDSLTRFLFSCHSWRRNFKYS